MALGGSRNILRSRLSLITCGIFQLILVYLSSVMRIVRMRGGGGHDRTLHVRSCCGLNSSSSVGSSLCSRIHVIARCVMSPSLHTHTKIRNPLRARERNQQLPNSIAVCMHVSSCQAIEAGRTAYVQGLLGRVGAEAHGRDLRHARALCLLLLDHP